MTVQSAPMTPGSVASHRTTEAIQRRIARRYAAERRFKFYGIVAILFGISFLVALFSTILVLVGLLLTDLSYALVDPRIRFE